MDDAAPEGLMAYALTSVVEPGRELVFVVGRPRAALYGDADRALASALAMLPSAIMAADLAAGGWIPR